MSKQLKITLKKSLNGRLDSHKKCIKGLGIKKIHKSVSVTDTPENLGMIAKVAYMLNVEEV